MSSILFHGIVFVGRALLAVLAFAQYQGGCLAAEPRVLIVNEANAPPEPGLTSSFPPRTSEGS